MSIPGYVQERLAHVMCDQDAAAQIVSGINSGTGLNAVFTSGTDATHLGFFGTGPITLPSAYTQTYAVALKTNAAMTASAVVTTSATSTTPFGYSQAQADAIVTAINALVADVTGVKKLLNSVIDDLQAYGLLQ